MTATIKSTSGKTLKWTPAKKSKKREIENLKFMSGDITTSPQKAMRKMEYVTMTDSKGKKKKKMTMEKIMAMPVRNASFSNIH